MWTRTTFALSIMCSVFTGCASVRSTSSPSNTASETCHECPIIMQLAPVLEGGVGMYVYQEGALWLAPEQSLKEINPYTDL